MLINTFLYNYKPIPLLWILIVVFFFPSGGQNKNQIVLIKEKNGYKKTTADVAKFWTRP